MMAPIAARIAPMIMVAIGFLLAGSPVGAAWRVSIGVEALDVELPVAEEALEIEVMKLG